MSAVSIILPSFRQPQFLGRAIESCLSQDHDDVEVIVVDDRSRDASLGLAVAWSQRDPRVKVIEARENGGLGKARNIGIAHARGEYLCFLDSDDYLLPGSLSARLDAMPGAFATHGDALAGVYGDWQHVPEVIDHPNVRAPRSNMSTVSAENFTGENVFICSAPLVRRDLVVAAGGFPEGLAMLEDFGLWARMIARGAVFAPVEHVVSTYRQRPNSMLRGDGVVVMADHVEIINSWMASEDVELSDGGAMAAWLANETPFSYGRMSWNVPSILGNFGGSPGAASVRTRPAHERDIAVPPPDFMRHPVASGLEDETPPISADDVEPEVAIHAHSLRHVVEAVAIVEELARSGTVARVFVEDPTDWTINWPLVLADFVPRAIDDVSTSVSSVIDLASPDQPDAGRPGLALRGVEVIWPDSVESDRSSALVYVPDPMIGHPGLDAWVSTALHVLAELELDPQLTADVAVRAHLGGWRSSIMSLDMFLRSGVVICPTGAHLELVQQIAPTVIFDPWSADPHARSRSELSEAVLRVGHVGGFS